jgi:serine/threonine protein kinase
MAIAIGEKLGAYEVTALLGEGGMGQVYRARDARLQRDVALKLLPDAFVSDSERLARFQREAQLLVSLNHPNIAELTTPSARASPSHPPLLFKEGKSPGSRLPVPSAAGRSRSRS